MSLKEKNVVCHTADDEQQRLEIHGYLQDADQISDSDIISDIDSDHCGDALESEHVNDRPAYQFSSEYEEQFKKNLIKYFGVENAEEIMAARKEAQIMKKAGMLPNPMQDIPQEFLTNDDRKIQLIDEDGHVIERDDEDAGQARKRRWINPTSWRGWSKAVAALVIVIVLGSAFTMSVDAFRVPVIHFFSQKENQQYNIITTESEADIISSNSDQNQHYHDFIEHTYVPGMVLEGYEEAERQELSRFIVIGYKNDFGNIYSFYQYVDQTDNWMNNEDTQSEECETDFGKAYFFEQNDVSNLVWDYDGYYFKIAGDFTVTEAIHLANSLILEQ